MRETYRIGVVVRNSYMNKHNIHIYYSSINLYIFYHIIGSLHFPIIHYIICIELADRFSIVNDNIIIYLPLELIFTWVKSFV